MAVAPKPKRSGGPKTPEGKAVASRNSIKFGAYSNLVVLPGENEADFSELEQHLQSDFQVVGVVETAMVHELAVLTWKRMRLERLEQKHVVSQLARNIEPGELMLAGLKFPEEAKSYLSSPVGVDGFNIKVFRLHQLHIERLLSGEIVPESIESLKEQNPELFEWLFDEVRSLGYENLTPQKLCNTTYTYSGISCSLVSYLLAHFRPVVEAILWVADHAREIAEAKERTRDQRLLNLMQAKGLQRTYDDLARAFTRTLTELRKQQTWRRKNKIIDVVEEPTTTPRLKQ